MKQTIGFSQFVDAFRDHDRYDQFGHAGLRVIFDYLESYEEDSGEEIELDVIAICCDYNMLDVDTIASEYSIDVDGIDEKEKREAVMEYLNDNTTVLGEADDQIIFAVF